MVFLIFCKFAAAFEEPMLTANPRSSFGIAGSSINQRRDKKKKKEKKNSKKVYFSLEFIHYLGHMCNLNE